MSSAARSAYHDWVMGDLFYGITGVTSRAMFGGWGIYRGGRMIALIAEDTLYLKTDEPTVADYDRERCEPFTYEGKGGKKVVITSYREVPASALDDHEEFGRWVVKAESAARRSGRRGSDRGHVRSSGRRVR